MTSKAVTQTDFYFQSRSTNQTAKQPGDVKSSFGQMMNQATSQKRTNGAKNANLQRSTEQVKVTRNSNDSKVKQNETLARSNKKQTREIDQTIEDKTEELIGKIAEELGVSIEDVEKAMEALGMQNADLLQPNALANLVVELSGETDLLALATNEELYSSLQALEQRVETICGEVEEAFSITPEELQQLIDKSAEELTQEVDSKLPVSSKDRAEVPNSELTTPNMEQDAEQNTTIPDEQEERAETDVVEAKNPQEGKTLEQVAGNQKETKAVEGSSEEIANQEQETLLNPLQNGAGAETENQSMMQQKSSASAQEETGSQEGKKEAIPEFMQTFSNQIGEKLDAALQNVKIPLETPDTERIMRQVMNQMKVHIGANITEMEMQLHPASLGTVNLQVAYKDGALTAQFTAQNETVKAAIESQIVQLRENLNDQGIKVEAIEVTIASHEFERNLSKGNDGQQEPEDSRKQGRRKLNLDSMDSLEEIQLEEAERIAVQLMKESGNTVDFTA